jgi:hypothetical protein
VSVETKVVVAILIATALVTGGLIWILSVADEYDRAQPCSYFANRTAKNIPARCLSEFNVKVAQ